MGKIALLPETLINQIAAGEVVERPASVVKELLENALDAGANKISIEILQAGSSLIRVRDNGSGIAKDDLTAAFLAHATSKIRSLEDLERVNTLGFRGEALASIASVSKTTLISRQENSPHAFQISPYLSNEISPAAHPVGTTVSVRELFYNTPARKKFLKSPRTEKAHIQQLIEKIAMSRAGVAISFFAEGKKVADFFGSDINQQIKSVMGEEFFKNSLEISKKGGDIHFYGRIAYPTFNAANAEKQFLFVNGRAVKDKVLAHAAKMAYQDVMYNGRQPIFVLFLAIDPEKIDVNMHPQKAEIRYREGENMHQLFYSTINQALRTMRAEHFIQAKTAETSNATVSFKTFSASSSNYNPPKQSNFEFKTTPSIKTELVEQSPLEPQKTLNAEEYPLGRPIMQLHNIFILSKNSQGLVLVDMHAAHERIIYEGLKADLRSKTKKSQKLLIPQTLEINELQEEIVEKNRDFFISLGYQFQVEESVLNIEAVPVLLQHYDNAEIFNSILEELENYPSSQIAERLEDEILSTIACHKAIRAGRHLTFAEMQQLLRDIENTPSANQCNHGRPTWLQLTEKELGKLFSRGQ